MGTLRSNTYPASQADNELLARSVLDGLSARVAVVAGSGLTAAATGLLARSVLDGLSARVAVVDGSGFIVFVNGAWRAFAVASGSDPAKTCEGAAHLGAR